MKKGFTLIELIISVAIMIILSGVIFTISLNSFKNSKVEGFSSEALSLIKRLYDYQNNEMVFVDQMPNKDIEETYNIIFQRENKRFTIKLRYKKNVLDEMLLSNIAFVGDIRISVLEKGFTEINITDSPYIFSFNSNGKVVSNIGDEVIDKLEINIGINEDFKNSIIISTPPKGNIILKKGG